MQHKIQLSPEILVAFGRQREVYLHPYDHTKLIKVLKTVDQMPRKHGFRGKMDYHFPSTRVRNVRKEYVEYQRFMLSSAGADAPPPMSHMYGFAMTNRGVGYITERIVQPDGSLGETLASKVKSGTLTDAHMDLLNDTIARMHRHDVRASDTNSKNFVFGHRHFGNDLGPEECVLVDGFGDIHAIPVRSMGRWFNRLGLNDSLSRMARKNSLHWDKDRRMFAQ